MWAETERGAMNERTASVVGDGTVPLRLRLWGGGDAVRGRQGALWRGSNWTREVADVRSDAGTRTLRAGAGRAGEGGESEGVCGLLLASERGELRGEGTRDQPKGLFGRDGYGLLGRDA